MKIHTIIWIQTTIQMNMTTMMLVSWKPSRLLHLFAKPLLKVGHTIEVVAEVVVIADEEILPVTNVVAEDIWLEHVRHPLEVLVADAAHMFSEWQEMSADIAIKLDIGSKTGQLT